MRRKLESEVHFAPVTVSLVGPAKIGKSEFLIHFSSSGIPFSDHYFATQDALVTNKLIYKSSDQPYNLKLKILDTPGQKRYQSMTILEYYNSNVVALFIDALGDFDEKYIEAELENISKYGRDTSVVIVMPMSDQINQANVGSKKEELNAIVTRLNANYKLKISNPIQVISSKTKFGIEDLGNVLIAEANEKIKRLNSKSKKAPTAKYISSMTQHPIVTAMLVGLMLGVILAATGIFAPFGVAIAGAIGLGAVGLVVFGVAAGLVKVVKSSSAPRFSPNINNFTGESPSIRDIKNFMGESPSVRGGQPKPMFGTVLRNGSTIQEKPTSNNSSLRFFDKVDTPKSTLVEKDVKNGSTSSSPTKL